MRRGQRVGVLGGTFDPFHNGHLVAAAAARHQLDLDRVLLVVAHRPWQKEGGRPVTDAGDRLAMVRAGITGTTGLEASTIEIDRGGPTFTIDTLEQLGEEDPQAELHLVIGTDVAAELGSWHRVEDLRAMANLAVVARPGAPAPDLTGWRSRWVQVPALAISSTDIRARVAAAVPVDGLVPAAVIHEIEVRRLYARP